MLGSKTWIGPSGQCPLLPKSEGDGYMLSAFVSREFGFGRVLTNEELDKVNAARRMIGKNTYIDEQAANEVLGTIHKSDLKESPLMKYLFIGASNEGYWNSFHMSVQFEDVVDCLQILYPEFEFVFFFDHSQGHARKRNGALSALNMSNGYGGAQAKMRETMIVQQEGYLGPHSPILKVGDTQSLIYLPTNSTGPWYLSPEQQQLQRHDRPTGKSRRVEKSKKLLMECLGAAGVTLQQQRGYTRKELQVFARNNGIELYENKEVIKYGWEGQPKGLLQVLWERGLIDCELIEKYTVDGRKDINGKVNLQYSLRAIMLKCQDFKEEETALQH